MLGEFSIREAHEVNVISSDLDKKGNLDIALHEWYGI